VCGRFVQVWDDVLGRFVLVYVGGGAEQKAILEDIRSQMDRAQNVPPGATVGALVGTEGQPSLAPVRWGFRTTVKGDRERPATKEVFNTRIEDAFESPMWRGLVGRRHAVVPVQGFYEWSGPATHRVPHFIERADGQPMMLAAVAGGNAASDAASGPATSVSIVTTAPNPFMARLHDRMPAILEADNVLDWLGPERLGHEGVLELAQPSRAQLTERVVSRKANAVANEGPDLLRPDPQSRLF
jgi:putative SOS response-associated peptidase YedK